MDLREFQEYVRQFGRAHQWDQEPVEMRLCYLMTEVGELTQAVLQWERHADPQQQQAAGQEIFDVIWNAVDVANHLGLDIAQCFAEKMASNADRTWLDKPPG